MMKILHLVNSKKFFGVGLITIGKGIGFVLFLLIIVLINTGCGLESITVLNEPSPGSTDPNAHTITFSGTSKNSEIEFKGFDVYYKFYKVDDYQNLQDDMNLSVSNPSDLVKKGFFRVTNSTDIPGNPTEPLILIPPLYRGTEYTITIDFSNIFLNKSDPVIYANNNSIISDLKIRRGVPDDSGLGYKSFYDYCFTCPDPDLTNISDVNPASDSIYIAFYVFSYGSDFENIYYSSGCYLGYLTINLGLLQ